MSAGSITALIVLGISIAGAVILRLRSIQYSSIMLGTALCVFWGYAWVSFADLSHALPVWLTQSELETRNYVAALFWLSTGYFFNALIKRYVYRRRLTYEGHSKVPLVIQYLVTILIFLIIVMIIMRLVFDQQITAIAAASGAVALIIGYSARTLLDEIFAGLAMNIKPAFEIGDLIQLNDEWAYVVNVDWRSITYLDMDQNHVVIPNTKLAQAKIRNLDRPSKITRRTMFMLVEINAPPKVVIDEVTAAMRDCPHIMPHPWNFISFYEFTEKGMRYKLHFHVEHYDFWYVASDELVNAIWYRFGRKGIRFGHQRRLNYTSPEDEKRGLPDSAYDEDHWEELIERFRQVPMFEGMTTDDMEELAKSTRLHIIGPPERIIRAGSSRSSMYLIADGEADVFEVDEKGKETWMAGVGEEETLGLMAILTGSPQRTTIRAKTECAVWEIKSDDLHALFERKPEVMNIIAERVTRWRAEEDEAISKITMSRQQEDEMLRQKTLRLTDRIGLFFQRKRQEDAGAKYVEY